MSAQGQLPLQLGAGAFYDMSRIRTTPVQVAETYRVDHVELLPCEACGAPAAWPCSPSCETRR